MRQNNNVKKTHTYIVDMWKMKRYRQKTILSPIYNLSSDHCHMHKLAIQNVMSTAFSVKMIHVRLFFFSVMPLCVARALFVIVVEVLLLSFKLERMPLVLFFFSFFYKNSILFCCASICKPQRAKCLQCFASCHARQVYRLNRHSIQRICSCEQFLMQFWVFFCCLFAFSIAHAGQRMNYDTYCSFHPYKCFCFWCVCCCFYFELLLLNRWPNMPYIYHCMKPVSLSLWRSREIRFTKFDALGADKHIPLPCNSL